MGEANAHYYATRDPLGAGGDFVTAPEISQMFGELIGLALADLWDRAGRPAVRYVELGPGRGTLAADALRAMRRIGLAPLVHFVETSPVLRAAQAERVPDARWHNGIDDLPDDAPLIIVANEFFDALPIRQFIRTEAGWREQMVQAQGDGFLLQPGSDPQDDAIPASLRDSSPGSIVETAPQAAAIMGALGRRLAAQGGAMLVFDYGHAGPAIGDTLQSVRAHGFADPLAEPGTRDLTAHVDFTALADAARAGGATPSRLVPQGEWLVTLGIAQRAAALARSAPSRAEEIAVAHRRLTAADQMGQIFKAMAFTASGWPTPAGF
ncbi:methyltransferase [Sphingomonas oleivorans]|uniref:Methyltransferase n=1 Tax=Sphingomonas oleivorans TaxID=1735121 RepID=A0A2T5G358_9SPHN|nr:SAM-dependent methyltransferase [Sphingomonas oleivorans]PTQ13579.1 methyltransferase [Sphingomonas oleivorans]